MRILPLLPILFSMGCAPASIVHVYSRSAGPPPPLDGRVVAILPTLAEGTDISPAVAAQATSDLVFADQLGSVRFIDSEETMALMADPTAVLGVLRTKAKGLREGKFALGGGVGEVLLERGAILGTSKDKASPKFVLRTEDSTLEATFPEYLEPALFEGVAVEADFALASIATTRYMMVDDIYAIFGILPYMGGKQVMAFAPFAAFALYDLDSGQKVWGSRVGSMKPTGLNPALQKKDQVDPRGQPVIGAAYLLTNDALGAMARAIGAPVP